MGAPCLVEISLGDDPIGESYLNPICAEKFDEAAAPVSHLDTATRSEASNHAVLEQNRMQLEKCVLVIPPYRLMMKFGQQSLACIFFCGTNKTLFPIPRAFRRPMIPQVH